LRIRTFYRLGPINYNKLLVKHRIYTNRDRHKDLTLASLMIMDAETVLVAVESTAGIMLARTQF